VREVRNLGADVVVVIGQATYGVGAAAWTGGWIAPLLTIWDGGHGNERAGLMDAMERLGLVTRVQSAVEMHA